MKLFRVKSLEHGVNISCGKHADSVIASQLLTFSVQFCFSSKCLPMLIIRSQMFLSCAWNVDKTTPWRIDNIIVVYHCFQITFDDLLSSSMPIITRNASSSIVPKNYINRHPPDPIVHSSSTNIHPPTLLVEAIAIFFVRYFFV